MRAEDLDLVRRQEIRRFERADPFRPFRICLSDGTEHVVGDPNRLFLAANMVILNIVKEGEDLPEDSIYFDPLHITRIETIRAES